MEELLPWRIAGLKKKLPPYLRVGVISIEEAFGFIFNEEISRTVLYEQNVTVSSSLRLHTFSRSVICSSCGLEGKFFAVERAFKCAELNTPFHLNLYATRTDGSEVLMTCDHTLARSLGGTNAPENTTTMCTNCNGKKAVVEGLKKELILLKIKMANIEKMLIAREAKLCGNGH